jgi:hypothetical protein
MSEENPTSQSDTQGGDKLIDMEDEEEEEPSIRVNDRIKPDKADEEVDESID